MNWSKGFSARFYATLVDPDNWTDLDVIDVASGTINKTDEDLIESADIECANFSLAEDERWDDERWIRVWLDARQGGDTWHGALFTGITSSPQLSIEGNKIRNSLQCYSVLKPAQDVLLPRGWYVLEGADGGVTVYNLLRAVIPAPIILSDGARTISKTIVAEDGETYLSMTVKILTDMKWRLRINGRGLVLICSQADMLSAVFDKYDNDCLETSVTIDCDWYSCPNVFRAVSDNTSAVARDDNPNSRLSTVNRKREIWMEETSCTLFDGESIGEYASRRLQEEQSAATVASYKRRFDPNVTVGDLIMLGYPEQGISGYYKVTSQNISLGYGATVSENASGYGGAVKTNINGIDISKLTVLYQSNEHSVALVNNELYMRPVD